jgi:AraC-like DNA-binding protein
MSVKLSIRSYAFSSHSHSHLHHQLVLPLVGKVFIDTGRHQGVAFPSQCIITLKNHQHYFEPEKGSSFLVVDLDTLPENMKGISESFVQVSSPMQAFCFYVQQQLENKMSEHLESKLGEWFCDLMAEQTFYPEIDLRIIRTLEYMQTHVSENINLDKLAAIAYLSLSQFKKLFKSDLSQTPGQYLKELRMKKAQALLTNTDYPISVIANNVGYQDLSAFSKSFSVFYGYSPKKLRK